MALSGNKETDFLILTELTDSELEKVCKVNKYVNSLCKDDRLWIQRLLKFFPITFRDAREMKTMLNIHSWKEYYQFMKEQH